AAGSYESSDSGGFEDTFRGAAAAGAAYGDDSRASIRALCVDARGGGAGGAIQAHGASGGPAAHSRELYPCPAGTHVRAEMERGGLDCAVGQSLWFTQADVSCRAQTRRTDAQLRELVRNYGTGVKYVRLGRAAKVSTEPDYSDALTGGGVGF